MKLQIDRNNLLLILILIIASFRSFAQIDILRFRPIELPHQIPYIQCLYQDNNGIIWLGTFDGLFQYDGYELVQYSNDPGDSLSLSDNKIQCIIEDAWGNLLIGTQSGLQYFDRRKMVFHKIDEMENQYVSKLVSGGDGEIYALSEMGVYRLHSNNVSGRHELNKIMDSHSAHSVIYTADQKLLITNGEQLYEINVGTNEDHEIEIFSMSDFKGTSITYLSVDSMGRIWISTNAGIHQFDPTIEKITAFAAWPRLAEKTQENIILEIDSIRFLVTNDQEIWEFDIQSKSFKGIFLEQHEMDQYNKYAFSLDILKTNQNNIMLCIDGKSLYQYNSDRSYLSLFPTDLFEKLLGPGLFYEIFEFQKNKIFISDKEYPKLLDLSDGSIKPFPYSLTPLMKSEPVWFTTFQAIDNNIWIGSNQGVYRYDRQKDVVENYLLKYIDYKFPDYFIIRDIWQDSRNNLWIAGWFHGLFRIDLETNILSKYDPLPSTDGMVVNKAIRAIYEDTQQGIWIGTRNGLLKYREITDDFVVYKHLNSDPESMSENTSFCIYQDSLGYIWSGSYGGGLNRLDTATGKFIHFTVREGLLSNNIFSLLPDDQGDLWMLSFEGITRFNPYTYEVINFTMENGLASNRYDGFLYGKSRFTDLLFFMGTSGIDILHPNRVKVSDYKPPVILTNFSLFNEPVSINIGVDSDAFMLDQSIVFAEQIGLNYDHRVFTIDYAALDYDGSEKIQYAYQLKGFDKDWQYVHNKRSATYTNLDPGQYEFKVRSTNSDGIWNDQYRSLFLTVASPWWTTWLAYLVYLILIVGLIYGLWYYQRRRWMLQTALHIQEGETKRLRDIDVLRTNLYTNITHEFRTPLTIISGVAKLIRDKPKEWVQQGSHTIEAQSQKLLAMVSRVLELQKIESGKLIYQPVQSDMIGFINYILEPFEFQAQSKKLQFEIAHQREYLIMDFDPQKLEIVVSNIVSNAMKFTSAGQITVSTFQNSSGGFCIRIVDTGIGINSNNLNLIFDRFYQVDESLSGTIGGTGIGLALVKELLPLMSGKVDVESNPGKGTTFLITLQMTTEATLRSVDYSFSQATTNLEDQIPTLLRIKSDINQPTLLIIEDNPDVRSYLIAILGDSYRVLEAQDGEQGIKVARDKIPELIISDVMMPGYDGYAVCEAVHNDLLTSHIPIILLTAKVDIRSRITGYKKGADVYLQKPFHPEELKAQISMLLEQRLRLQQKYQHSRPPESSLKQLSKEDRFLSELYILIQSHLSDDEFGIKEICQHMLVSRSQLHTKVKAVTGFSTTIFIRKLRLEEAQKLIKNSDLSISEIAYQVGFRDPNFFSRVYKKEFGESPSEGRL